MPKTFPPKFYKYQMMKPYSLESIRNKYIWFSKPSKLNDPFDCSILYNLVEPSLEDYKALFESFDTNIKLPKEKAIERSKLFLTDGIPNENFRREFRDGFMRVTKKEVQKLSQMGVACFSEKVDSILMWSHYTNGHKGFCLEFDSQYKPFMDRRRVHKVSYSESFPSLNPADVILGRLTLRPALLLTKSKHWSYEKEWRLIKNDGIEKFYYDSQVLTGVYFGCLMPDKDKERIAKILANTPTALYEMKRAEDSFKLIYSPYSL